MLNFSSGIKSTFLCVYIFQFVISSVQINISAVPDIFIALFSFFHSFFCIQFPPFSPPLSKNAAVKKQNFSQYIVDDRYKKLIKFIDKENIEVNAIINKKG